MARVQNSLLTKPTDQLEPLMTSNNTAVDGFPTTPGEITTMGVPRLNSILQQLGLPTAGGRAAKETRLRQNIGLPPVAGP